MPCCRRLALLTERMRDVQKVLQAHRLEKRRQQSSFVVCLYLQTTNVLCLGKAKNGFVKTEKSGGKQVIKNVFHVTTNVAMKPCL